MNQDKQEQTRINMIFSVSTHCELGTVNKIRCRLAINYFKALLLLTGNPSNHFAKSAGSV